MAESPDEVAEEVTGEVTGNPSVEPAPAERVHPMERARRAWAAARAAWVTAHRALAKIDPNDDPDAEPLGLLPVAALVVGVIASSWMFLRWKYQPMQDYWHYAALATIVTDWGRHGSLYTPLYEKPDLLAANSLVYAVAGYLGRLIGTTQAMRVCMMTYIAGLPLVTAYALRVFGRSPWPALLAVPLVFWNLSFLAGFVNMLVSAPLMVLTLVTMYRLFVRFTRPRLAGVTVLFALLFLTHAHTFLWTGILAFLLTLGFLFASVREPSRRAAAKRAGIVAGTALAAVTPALLLFLLWYRRSAGTEAGGQGTSTHLGSGAEGFGAVVLNHEQQFATLFNQFHIFADGKIDAAILISLASLTLLAIGLARYHRFNKPPLLEIACALTGIAYFFLPESIKGQEIISQRHPGMALWLLPALVSPVPWRASRVARVVVVAGILGVSTFMLRTWHEELVKFEKDEAAGLDAVMRAAPPRARMHYVKTDPGSSYFGWRPFWHVEKAILPEKLGQTPDTGGINATSCIHYRPGVNYHRITNHTPSWPDIRELWTSFDVILIRRWHPTPDQLRRANEHGERIAQAGDWELWRSKEAEPPVTEP
jgi:hypothetical protein